MRFVYLTLISIILSVSAYAQPTKIAIINSAQFSAEKGGITKLVAAYNTLDVEFKPASDEIAQINTKLSTLSKELSAIQDQFSKPGVDAQTLRNQYTQKEEEGQNLQITLKRKQEDAKARYERREEVVTGPIIKEITDAMSAYIKAHGIDLLLDASKLESLLAFNPAIDVTDAFIKEFNAKSAGVPIKQP